MNLLQRLEPVLALGDRAVRWLQCLAPLLTRLVFGVGFFHAGLGKWHHFDRTIAYFTDLGIPAPAANAAFVSTLEVVGGLALVLGLLTRVFAALLSSTMVVAILTAERENFTQALNLHGETSLTDVVPVVFLLALLGLVAFGPGKIALDRLMPWSKRAVDGSKPSVA